MPSALLKMSQNPLLRLVFKLSHASSRRERRMRWCITTSKHCLSQGSGVICTCDSHFGLNHWSLGEFVGSLKRRLRTA